MTGRTARLRPRDAIGPGATRVLLAVLRLYDERGRLTVRDVAAYADRSVSVTHGQLWRLYELGLVEFRPGRPATLRPTCAPVPIGSAA